MLATRWPKIFEIFRGILTIFSPELVHLYIFTNYELANKMYRVHLVHLWGTLDFCLFWKNVPSQVPPPPATDSTLSARYDHDVPVIFNPRTTSHSDYRTVMMRLENLMKMKSQLVKEKTRAYSHDKLIIQLMQYNYFLKMNAKYLR